eukprot:NODE_1932_length_1559_cov_122.893454_g1839_i0.p1 GENE.NODE_1932_length_1559_cov_122.893454_g1839_i0~~NODE_1932_length_1559_cov_122.893454_g1839_i0.p1  ORF type:complete len:375 (-),score=47.61 NODE_1932_length_1559_cov_122.893454_g1839_i0:396-1520(-)
MSSAFVARNKVVVVTGGANGIGKAICQACAAEEAKAIVVVDLELSAASELASSLPRGVAMQADCGKEEDIARIISRTLAEVGPIDMFVANAGISGSMKGFGVTNDEWAAMTNVHIMQHVYAARHVLPSMAQRGGCCFVVMASSAALLGMPPSMPYAVTKHASLSVAEWLAVAFHDKVQVACVCPAAVRTELLLSSMGRMAEHLRKGGSLPKDMGAAGMKMAGGLLEPKDVAASLLEGLAAGKFLITPHAAVRSQFAEKTVDYSRWDHGYVDTPAIFMPAAPISFGNEPPLRKCSAIRPILLSRSSVRTAAGHTQATCTLSWKATASHSATDRDACLVTAYGIEGGMPRRAADEAITTKQQPPRWAIDGRTCLAA